MRKRISGLLATCLLATTTAAASGPPSPAPTSPACLATVGVPDFAGHNFPLDSAPDPAPMTVVDAFPGITFTSPIYAVVPPDGTERLFVVERAGRIRILEDGAVRATAFLDIRNDVMLGGEFGMFSMAFPPDYATSRIFYVFYAAKDPNDAQQGLLTLARYQTSADPNVANAASREVLLSLPKPRGGCGPTGTPFNNHNGGTIAFGPDGFLYWGLGDGGSGGDPCNLAQDDGSYFGKMLRLDVSGGLGGGYAVPASNPFRAPGLPLDEIWAKGLRNPFRFSFDRGTGNLWIGDVGQAMHEEVDLELAGDPGGRNYGWRRMEGFSCYNPSSNCADASLALPVHDYPRSDGASITGGVVYRGDRFPSLFGAYVYGDFSSGNVWAYPAPTASLEPTLLASGVQFLTHFAEDPDGELLMLQLSTGRLLRLEEATGGSSGFPTQLSATGLFSNTAVLAAKPGLVEYRVNAGFWSDRAEKRRWLAIPAGTRVTFSPHGRFEFPVGTVFVKHFTLALADGTNRRLETRVIVRQADRYVAYTYRWNDAQSDATLVTTAQQASYAVNPGTGPETLLWTYPGPGDCLGCHTAAAGRVLGVNTRQLNLEWTCEGRLENQLATLGGEGLFLNPPPVPAALPRLASPTDTTDLRGLRARSYLDANCAFCHQPDGPAPGGLDLRSGTSLTGMNVVNVAPTEGSLGLASPMRVLPGNKSRSVLWHRLQSADPAIHMPAALRVVDPTGVSVIGAWIDADPRIDGDGDGVPSDSDLCPSISDAGQADTDGDHVGNVCDRCVTLANRDQSDLDTDGTGDVCDDRCVGPVTTIAEILPAAQRVGQSVEITGTGFSPNARVLIGGLEAAVSRPSGRLLAVVPALAYGYAVPVVVVNPEGCRSLDARALTIAEPMACGLLGFEALAPVALACLRRRRRAGVS